MKETAILIESPMAMTDLAIFMAKGSSPQMGLPIAGVSLQKEKRTRKKGRLLV
jgi:hypothetical protein